MKNLPSIILFFLSFNLCAQDLSGTWKGTCTWDGNVRNLTLIIDKPNGTLYKGRGIETGQDYSGKDYSVTFDFQFFSKGSSGVIQSHKVTNVLLHMNGAEIDYEFKSFAKRGIAICDDSLSFEFGYDNRYNYLEFICSDDLVSWSVAQKKIKIITP